VSSSHLSEDEVCFLALPDGEGAGRPCRPPPLSRRRRARPCSHAGRAAVCRQAGRAPAYSTRARLSEAWSPKGSGAGVAPSMSRPPSRPLQAVQCLVLCHGWDRQW